jgi:anti-anti-sigma factor
MKRHLTLCTTSPRGDDLGDATAAMANGADSLAGKARTRAHLTPVPPKQWMHTLILKGNLDDRSAHELEEEIECLCQEGVTNLTLDLGQLDAADPRAADLIASRSAYWKRRGRHFSVLCGSDAIRRAFAEVGSSDLLTPEPTIRVGRRFSSASSGGDLADVSTTMIRELGRD